MSLADGTPQNISIVLYKPKYAGNVGSIARAAKNMGITKIIVVGVSDLDADQMYQRSTHLAADVVDAIQYKRTLEEALADFAYIVGTTARQGRGRGPFVSPRTAAEAIACVAPKNKVALLFGPEDTGLSNEEIRYCQSVTTIPTSDAFRSLNLSHAVIILSYEIFLALSEKSKTSPVAPKWARSSEIEGMYAQLKTTLAAIGFLRPENPDYWMMHLRRFFSRSGLLAREVKIIRGICRQIDWAAGRSSSNKKT
ncbi:MAG TPA: RNA methyltransferase [Smithellaceae bacterium]|nr:RNA methyltransferase [Smithellaceae bacterium]